MDWFDEDDIGRPEYDPNEHLRSRVDRLERHIDDYFEWLEESLEHDRQFQMKATWGLIHGANFLFALGGVAGLTKLLDIQNTWIEGAMQVVAFFAIYVALHAYTEKGREGDLKKLSRLPKWHDIRKRW